ncbi:hypothetical protein D7Y13_25540 [Corallococcus praedator]|uniref:Lipoprotein n=1 Tax=Corallococcus praedator TaxID=2316724 RepID=A0ABX9QD06_9BACT|nr:hypothetical protein D7X74_14865 [Corallococcus sp. CA047B]RKH30954.1 hypothetical protein D7X75_20405 [Corallococcus sp. CA031C]RKI01113.1 hypothetical protein D7Y13_25540 [Corallococcus praedator]
MKRVLAALLPVVLLPACALFQRAPRPVHAPPEEAATVQFPSDLPATGLQELSGTVATAIQLAMDDFRPPGSKPHRGATPTEQCLYRRQSFDVQASPGPEGIVFVRFLFNPDACTPEERAIALDMGATYAIDVQGWRILAIQP